MKLVVSKNKIDSEREKIENKDMSTVTGKRSVLISIIMIFYAFIIIGSSVQSNISFMLIIRDAIRVIAIICGVYLFYLNLYMTFLQLKLNRKWIGYLAAVFNAISILYFFFVSFVSISEILDTFLNIK